MKLHWPTASLRSYLVAAVLLAGVPSGLLMSLQILRELRLQTMQMNQGLLQMAGVLAQSVDRELVSSIEALELLAEAVGGESSLRSAQAQVQALTSRARLRPAWQSLYLADAQGRPLWPAQAEAPPPLTSAPSGAAEVAAAPSARVSGLVRLHDGSYAVSVSVPVRLQGNSAAYRLGAWIPARHWQELLQQSGVPADGFSALLDPQRHVIARSPALARPPASAQPGIEAAALEGAAPVVRRAVTLDGQPAYAAGHGVPVAGWAVSVGRPAAAVDLEHGRQALAAFGTAALTLLLGVTLALWVARRITAPLRALGTQGGVGGEVADGIADGAGGGASDVAPGAGAAASGGTPGDAAATAAGQASPVREIRQLQDAISASRALQARARRELQQRADDFETLFRLTPIGLAFTQDPGCDSVLHNDALTALLHLAHPAQGEAGPQWRMFQGQQALDPAQQPLALAAHSGQAVPATPLELRFGASEPLRFVVVQAVPLRAADGAPRGAIAAYVDVTDQRQLERHRAELVEREQGARQVAEAANQAKDELLAMLGHELRNPLNAIASAAEVLKLLGGGGPRADDARGIVERQTRHLAHLTSEMLDVARLTAGPQQLERWPVDLAQVVELRVAALRRQPGSGGDRLTLSAEPAWVEGDANRLAQVAGQLIDNALKHAPPDSRVGVSVRAEPEHAVLEVSDEGQGISPELLPRIFDLFVQGERAPDRARGGLGVGLALVRRLVQLHGGSVAADSDGQGSRFTVRLPRIAAPLPSASEHPGRRARRVLLVEDNADALLCLCAALELDGHALSTATDGETGLAMLLAQRPEVAVIDIGLPLLTGLELARRSRGAGYAGRLIALSGYGLDNNARDALRAGFDAHLAKPVDFDRLRELLALE